MTAENYQRVQGGQRPEPETNHAAVDAATESGWVHQYVAPAGAGLAAAAGMALLVRFGGMPVPAAFGVVAAVAVWAIVVIVTHFRNAQPPLLEAPAATVEEER